MDSTKYTPQEALRKLKKYCAYQERCHQEVKQRLYTWGFHSTEAGNIVVHLIEGGFLNEERYAKALAGGKFRQKGWGKNKIKAVLASKGIVSRVINTSLNQIEEADYRLKLQKLIEKKAALLHESNANIKKQKLARFAISKGYESDMVWAVLAEFLSGE